MRGKTGDDAIFCYYLLLTGSLTTYTNVVNSAAANVVMTVRHGAFWRPMLIRYSSFYARTWRDAQPPPQ